MGVQLPLPAPSIQFIFSDLLSLPSLSRPFSGTNLGTMHILFTFNRLKVLALYSSPVTLYIVSVVYARLPFARRIKCPLKLALTIQTHRLELNRLRVLRTRTLGIRNA